MILEHLPVWAVRILPELSLLLIGLVVEEHYVSRVTIFTNSLALTVYLVTISEPGFVLTTYAEIGVVLGLYGMLQYLRRDSAGRAYYLMGFYLYGSLTVFFILILPIHPLLSFAVALLAHLGMEWSKGFDEWTYTGSRAFPVHDFINTNSVTYPDYELGKQVRVPLSDIF